MVKDRIDINKDIMGICKKGLKIMTINKAVKVRLYPNKTQLHKINVTLGCSRYIYNDMLARNIKVYERRGEHLNYNVMQNLLPVMKKYKAWLADADSQALKYACRQVDTAYQKFFKHETKFPRFHKKHGRQSYTTTNMSSVKFDRNKVKLPCLGWVRCRGLRQLPDGYSLCRITISREPDGTYFASINYKYEAEIPTVNMTKQLRLKYENGDIKTEEDFRKEVQDVLLDSKEI